MLLNRFQIRETGDFSAIDPGAWTNVTEAPAQVAFTRPAGDQVVTVYTWFTNATESVTARRAVNTIVYTETPPTVAAPNVLRRPIDGFTVRLTHPDEVDAGSTGGVFGDLAIPIYSRELRFDGDPALDQTPVSAFFTFDAPGDYPFTFRVMNAAGNVTEQPFTLQIRAESLPAGNRFVAVGNLNEAAPFSTWETAATAIRDAIAVADEDDLIQVAPGWYRSSLNPVVSIDRPVRLRGVWGPDYVVVDGQNIRQCLGLVAGAGRVDIEGFSFAYGFNSDRAAALNLSRIGAGSSIRNCIVRDNVTGYWAPIFFGDNLSNDIVFEHCVFKRNQGDRGAVFVLFNSNHRIHVRNCLFYDNLSPERGGVIHIHTGSSIVVFENCTMVRNRSTGTVGGGAISRDAGSIAVTNSIVYHNTAPFAENLVQNHRGTITWSHSLTGPYLRSGAGNLAEDPLLADLTGGDFRLTRESPARDVGINLPWMADAFDLDGRPRLDVGAGVVDMGCYELPPIATLLLVR